MVINFPLFTTVKNQPKILFNGSCKIKYLRIFILCRNKRGELASCKISGDSY
jgi:hypothetical protein